MSRTALKSKRCSTARASRSQAATESSIAVHGDEFDSHDGQLKLTGADEHLRAMSQPSTSCATPDITA